MQRLSDETISDETIPGKIMAKIMVYTQGLGFVLRKADKPQINLSIDLNII